MPRLNHPPHGTGRRGRSRQARDFRRTFLIVCEGEVTEVCYFQAFPVPKEVRVAVHGEGKNTTTLVDAAIHHADCAERPFDDVWVVYDHDDFGADKFNRADAEIPTLNANRGERWHAAWSHQAFEVWYLLHFQFFDGRLHRHLVQAKVGEQLKQHCGRTGYRKNDPNIYELSLDRQDAAIKRAQALAETHGVAPHGDATPASANPCTLVYRLVEALNAELR